MATVAVGAGLLFAPSASAAHAAVSLFRFETPVPEVGQGVSGETAATLTVVFTPSTHAHAVNDAYTLTLPADCGVRWAALPTVISTGTATVSAALSNSGACPLGVNDTLTITVTGAGTGNFAVVAPQYNVLVGAPRGPVTLTLAQTAGHAAAGGIVPDTAVNAFVTPAKVGVTSQAVTPSQANVSVNDITIVEQHGAGFSTGTICVRLDPDNIADGAAFRTDAPFPTVSSTGDPASIPGVGGVTATFIRIDVTASAATSTITLSGVRINAGATPGPITVDVVHLDNATCTGDNDDGTRLHPTPSLKRLAVVVTATRLSGPDRIGTARSIAVATFGCREDSHALISRADLFPDALSGNYHAGRRDAPTLLVRTNEVSPETLLGLRQLGVRSVTILGETAAVSAAVEQELRDTPQRDCAGAVRTVDGVVQRLEVERIGGVDRFETSRFLAVESSAAGIGVVNIGAPAPSARRTGILATGLNFPDALAAGPLAFRGKFAAAVDGDAGEQAGGFPVLLTRQESLHPQAQAAITELGITQLIIVGGTAVISQAQEDALRAAGIHTLRLSGPLRTDTAARIAEFARTGVNGLAWAFSPGATHGNLARGDLFPDALTGGPHGGREHGVILLATNPTTLGAATDTFLRHEGNLLVPMSNLWTLHIFGGTAAIADSTVLAARTASARG